MTDRFIPNDPLLAKQWHLINTGQTGQIGNDVNVLPAWRSVTGKGVVIGVVDSGVDYTHPDLQANYRADLSFDFEDNDNDPSPSEFPVTPAQLQELLGKIELEPGIGKIETFVDSHGTGVAGVAAASGNNGQGVTGVAPNAEIAAIRLDSTNVDKKVAKALSYKNQEIDIYNSSWGAANDGRTVAGPGLLGQAALENGVTQGRGGLGNIFVWGAGNGLESNDNVNYDGWANSRYTIAVSAINANGEQARYSDPGAPILVTTYSNDSELGQGRTEGIVTTDVQGKKEGYSLLKGASVDTEGDYINNFGGTSSSAPLASGVIALMLEANPNLTWRDVQHILVNTATQNDASDSDWSENGAGHLVNHKYGFGSIDASAAVDAAKTWNTVDPEVSATSETLDIQTEIPENSSEGLSSTLTIDKDINLESVELIFDAEHASRGDLEVTLISSDGTKSILAEQRNDPNDNYDKWTFTSVRHWGESSLGDWTVTVKDKTNNDLSGVWNSAQLKVYGTKNSDNSNPPELNFGTVNADVLEVDSTNQLVFAGNGNDLIDATASVGNNRIYGGDGDDTLILGTGDRFVAGAGADRFFVGDGGNNTLTGGEGADQFWIAIAEIPNSPNIITDYNPTEDAIAIAGLGIGFNDLNLIRAEDDVLIKASRSDLAIFQEITIDSLGADNFVFA